MPRGILVPYWLLEKLSVFTNRSEATQEVILRALKAGMATIIAILLTAAASGVLFPADWSPILIIAITVILQAVDKWLRTESEPPVVVIDVPIPESEDTLYPPSV